MKAKNVARWLLSAFASERATSLNEGGQRSIILHLELSDSGHPWQCDIPQWGMGSTGKTPQQAVANALKHIATDMRDNARASK